MTKQCKVCGKEFTTIYNQSRRNYLDKQYCSITCSNKDRVVYSDKQSLIALITDYILDQNRYCTGAEIRKALNVSSKTLTKYSISVASINESVGFAKKGSQFALSIYKVLIKYFDNVVSEATFYDLLSPKGFNLRIDFYIPEYDLLIEADGEQHHDTTNIYFSDYLIACDRIKDEYAVNNNKTMVRIPYTRLVTEEYIKKYITAIP